MAQEIKTRKIVSNTARNLYRHSIAVKYLPKTKQYLKFGATCCREKLLPGIKTGSFFIGKEVKKIHGKQNWFKRCGTTIIDNAAGLGMAMLAGKIVESQFETQQFSNLWGLLATRPVISENTYMVLSFSTEFIIALIVFTLTEHYLDEYRDRKRHTGSEMKAN